MLPAINMLSEPYTNVKKIIYINKEEKENIQLFNGSKEGYFFRKIYF